MDKGLTPMVQLTSVVLGKYTEKYELYHVYLEESILLAQKVWREIFLIMHCKEFHVTP
jgi:hypothetical protein